jgi:hypothetical protein
MTQRRSIRKTGFHIAFAFATMFGLIVLSHGSTSASSATQEATATPIPKPTRKPNATRAPNYDALVLAPTLNMTTGPLDPRYETVLTLNQSDKPRVIGQFNNCAWLKVQFKGKTGWLAGNPAGVQLVKPCDKIRHGTFRPFSSIAFPNQRPGNRYLDVSNQTGSDCVVILVDQNQTDKPIYAAYVRTGDSFRLEGVGNGTYKLYFSTGAIDSWDGDERKFTRGVRLQKFDVTFKFGRTAGWRVTLHAVVRGNASASGVPPIGFPSLK